MGTFLQKTFSPVINLIKNTHRKTTAWPHVGLLDMNEKQGVGTWICICLGKKWDTKTNIERYNTLCLVFSSVGTLWVNLLNPMSSCLLMDVSYSASMIFYSSNPSKNVPSPCILYDYFYIFWDFICIARTRLLQFKVTFMLDQWKQQERTKRQHLRVVNECSMYEKAFRTKPGSADRQRRWKMWKIVQRKTNIYSYIPHLYSPHCLNSLSTHICFGKRFGFPLVIFSFDNSKWSCW